MDNNQSVMNYFLSKKGGLVMQELWKLEHKGRLAQVFYDKGKHKFFLDNRKLVEYDAVYRILFSNNGERYAIEVRDNDRERIYLDGIEYPSYKTVDSTVFSLDSKHFAYRAMKDNGKYCVVTDGKEGKEYDDIADLCYGSDGTLSYCASIDGLWCRVADDKEVCLYGW